MRLLLLTLLCITLAACARPQIVELHFPPEKTLHMSSISEVPDNGVIDRYIFYLNQGDTVPLKLKMDCKVLDFGEPHLKLVLKEKIYFRVDMAEDVSRADLEKVLNMTSEEMAAMKPEEMLKLVEKFRLYISGDGSTWALLTSKEGVKEVLGLDHGSISAGMALSKDEGLWFLLSLVIHNREEA